ncbi:alpha/beta fold hydrolase [Geodermatophilus marinus]|uniref:alpha/beta fold hydrolase n=1 Tax=Geodermatophilus sp. LHW52908 TaxID=2303986 RepID=UPI001314C131|nr:alpha/beta fold hydrolase [Geodermatophilus sp. LHW52908]
MPFFTGSHGRVHHEAWLPDGAAERVVVLLHGYGEHLGLYGPLVRRLVADGAAVHALDAMGHGRSDGERAVLDWDGWVDDARQLTDLARDRHPGRPVVLVGHSAGGLAAYLLALRSPGTADGLVLSGAPLRRQEWVEAVLADGPEEEVADVDPSEVFSTHPGYVHALLHDPLTWHGGFRPEMLRALVRAWPEAAAGLAQGLPDLPVLFVHGEDDPVVPVADSRASAAQLPQARVVTFPGDLHDVLNEHDRDRVHEVVAGFVAARTEIRATAPV